MAACWLLRRIFDSIWSGLQTPRSAGDSRGSVSSFYSVLNQLAAAPQRINITQCLQGPRTYPARRNGPWKFIYYSLFCLLFEVAGTLRRGRNNIIGRARKGGMQKVTWRSQWEECCVCVGVGGYVFFTLPFDNASLVRTAWRPRTRAGGPLQVDTVQLSYFDLLAAADQILNV